jgi:hypothetical protein
LTVPHGLPTETDGARVVVVVGGGGGSAAVVVVACTETVVVGRSGYGSPRKSQALNRNIISHNQVHRIVAS